MKSNLLDRAIGFMDPAAGVRRLRARAALDVALRYEGAERGRRTGNWLTSSASANAEIGPDLAYLRNRSRDMNRNIPLARKATKVLVSNTVGTGITPEADTGDRKLNKVIDAAYQQWSAQCDANGQLTFAGLQSVMHRCTVESGEVIVRDRYRYASDGLFIPYQIQVLEPDYLDSNRQFWPNEFNGVTIQGVALSPLGIRNGYWMFPWHPGDIIKFSTDGFVSKLISADQITHLYEVERPGQVRGVPWLSAAMLAAYDLDGYKDAERMRKKIEACMSVFVEQAEGENGPALSTISTDAKTGNRIETMEPGMIEYLKPGEKISTASPASAGGYGDYVSKEQHDLAAGFGVMYEQATGDLSQVNYSSYRAGGIEFRVDVESFRAKTFIPMGLQPIWNKFVDAGILAGRIPKEANHGCKWTAPEWQSVDPEKDAGANLLDVRSGRKTWGQSVIETGRDPRKQLKEITRYNQKFDDAGVILDIDPRNVDRNRGAFQVKVTDAIDGAPPNGDAAPKEVKPNAGKAKPKKSA